MFASRPDLIKTKTKCVFSKTNQRPIGALGVTFLHCVFSKRKTKTNTKTKTNQREG